MSAGYKMIASRDYACIPLALTTTEVVFDIVDCVTGSDISLAVLGLDELVAEDLVVWLGTALVDNNSLLVVGDLEDNVLDFAVAQTELIEEVDTLVGDGNSVRRMSINQEWGRGISGFVVPGCEL